MDGSLRKATDSSKLRPPVFVSVSLVSLPAVGLSLCLSIIISVYSVTCQSLVKFPVKMVRISSTVSTLVCSLIHDVALLPIIIMPNILLPMSTSQFYQRDDLLKGF